MSYKIITLGICNRLKTSFLDQYYNENYKKYNIKRNLKDGIETYSISINNNLIKILNKDYMNYFRESNLDYYSNVTSIIIFLNSNNENLINNLKLIWFEELKNNKVPNNIPILIINFFKKNNNFEKNIYQNISYLSDYYQSINYISMNKDLLHKENKKIINITLNKLLHKVLQQKN